jgi:hypothetical protein
MRDPLQQLYACAIKRVIDHFKINPAIAINMISSPTASLMPRRMLNQFWPRPKAAEAAEAHGPNGDDVGRCIADNKRVHRALR